MLEVGSKWVCTDERFEQNGNQCVILSTDSFPESLGGTDLKVKYEDGSVAYMKAKIFVQKHQLKPAKRSWTRFSILNQVNNKYDISSSDITNFDEAREFWEVYFAPLADIAPNFLDRNDAELVCAVMETWGDLDSLKETVYPLLTKSTIYTNQGGK